MKLIIIFLPPRRRIEQFFHLRIQKCSPKNRGRHNLRHTFGSLLIQIGASIVQEKEQKGHSSIQVTVDTYGHLIPGANVFCLDRLDQKPTKKQAPAKQPSATPAQPRDETEIDFSAHVVDLFGGGRQDRTADLRVMNPSL